MKKTLAQFTVVIYKREVFNVEHGEQMIPANEKVTFKSKGWSYRSAAPVLGVTYQYLCEVMNGRRVSRRLSAKIRALPKADRR